MEAGGVMLKTFSFGGGVQSTAVMVLVAQGIIKYDFLIFAHVGDDSENPDTLDYIENYSKSFARDHGIELITVKAKRKGMEETLSERILGNNNKMTPIPVYGSITGAPMPRRCTEDFKIIPIAQWIRRQGYREAIVGLGISLDEIHRMKTKEPKKIAGIWETVEYPLIDLRIKRDHCMRIITDAGLPLPPRSACYFCPFHSPGEWMILKERRPDLFDKAVIIEKAIQEKASKKNDIGTYYLHTRRIPLEKAVGYQYSFFDEMENCESGYCFI